MKRGVIHLARKLRRVSMEWRASALGMIDKLDGIVASAETVHGWVRGNPAKQMALTSYALAGDPTIVEIGVFMGRSTVLLAAPRALRGTGRVHSVDAFDCSGDEYSMPIYQNELASRGYTSLEAAFRQNVSRQKLGKWVEIHKGTSRNVASTWTQPIDLLLLDGDQSPEGALEAYELWSPFLKKGGTIILQNTADRTYAKGHDGNRRVSLEKLKPPYYSNVRQLEYMTLAVKEFRETDQ